MCIVHDVRWALVLLVVAVVLETGVVGQRCPQFDTPIYGGRHGEHTLAKLTVARQYEAGGQPLAGAERPRFLAEECSASGLLRCRGGSPAGWMRRGKAGAQDHMKADVSSDSVSETTAEFRQAEQRLAVQSLQRSMLHGGFV